MERPGCAELKRQVFWILRMFHRHLFCNPGLLDLYYNACFLCRWGWIGEITSYRMVEWERGGYNGVIKVCVVVASTNEICNIVSIRFENLVLAAIDEWASPVC